MSIHSTLRGAFPRLNAPRVLVHPVSRLASPKHSPLGVQHVFVESDKDSGSLLGWLAVMALPTGWLVVLLLPMCVLKFVVGIVDATRFAQEVAAKFASMSVRRMLMLQQRMSICRRVVLNPLATWGSSRDF